MTVILNPKVKEHTVEDPKRACDFCQRTEINKLMSGPMQSLEDGTVHYFCMLFSAGLSQYRKDNEGILGFMPRIFGRSYAGAEKSNASSVN